MDQVTMWVDGGVIGNNPGEAVFYTVVEETPQGKKKFLEKRTRVDQYTTNNEAEYLAVRAGLQHARRRYNTDYFIKVRSDSRLIINQLHGDWRVKADNLRDLWYDTIELIEAMRVKGYSLQLQWVRRDSIVEVVGH